MGLVGRILAAGSSCYLEHRFGLPGARLPVEKNVAWSIGH